jgi:long-chain acyl-CoA synthetase
MVFALRRFTYRELQEKVNALAIGLSAWGCRRENGWPCSCPTAPPYVIGYYASLQVGAIVVNLNPLAVERELLFFLNHAEVRTLIVAQALFSRIANIAPQSPLENILVACPQDWGASAKLSGEEKTARPGRPAQGIFSFEALIHKHAGAKVDPVDLHPEDEALLQYSGAIADGVKGVVLTHGTLVANTLQMASWAVRARPGKEVFLSVLPFFNIYGMAVAMNLPIKSPSGKILRRMLRLEAGHADRNRKTEP